MTIFKRSILPNVSIEDRNKIRKFDEDILRYLNELDESLDSVLNMGVSFFENTDSVAVTFTSSGVADTENTVPHTLGKVPVGFLVYSIDKGAVVYNGTTAWTATNIYLKVNTATTVVKVLIF